MSTIIELSFFNLFLVALAWGPVAAKVVSSLIALVSAYLGNREWAFRERRGSRTRGVEIVLFVTVNAICTSLGALLVWLGTLPLGGQDHLLINLVNIASIGIVVVLRFTLYHAVVFRRPAAVAPVSTEIEGELRP